MLLSEFQRYYFIILSDLLVVLYSGHLVRSGNQTRNIEHLVWY